MNELIAVLEAKDTLDAELVVGKEYYKGDRGIPGKDGKDGSDQVYIGADEPTDERVKLWIDTDATPSSGAEPDAYIKDASVSGNTLTLTKKDDTEVVFTPSGGSSGGVSGYAFTSYQTFTDEDKLHLKEVYQNKNVYMTINDLTVVRTFNLGSKRAYVVINTNGASSNQVQVYSVDIDGNGNVTSSSFSLYMSYGLMGSETLTGTILTTNNWTNYINIPEIKDWVYTSDMKDSNLYNATEMIVLWRHNNMYASTYFNLAYGKYDSGNTGAGNLGDWGWENLLLAGNTGNTSTANYLIYTGSELATGGNVEYLYGVLYKT